MGGREGGVDVRECLHIQMRLQGACMGVGRSRGGESKVGWEGGGVRYWGGGGGVRECLNVLEESSNEYVMLN